MHSGNPYETKHALYTAAGIALGRKAAKSVAKKAANGGMLLFARGIRYYPVCDVLVAGIGLTSIGLSMCRTMVWHPIANEEFRQ